MSTQHTPGPWAYAPEYGPNITEPPCITTVARCANFVIGQPSDYPGGNYRDGDPSGDEEADAHLIAAAPELLDLLERAVRRLEIEHRSGSGVMREWVVDARAAIAKVEAGK